MPPTSSPVHEEKLKELHLSNTEATADSFHQSEAFRRLLNWRKEERRTKTGQLLLTKDPDNFAVGRPDCEVCSF